MHESRFEMKTNNDYDMAEEHPNNRHFQEQYKRQPDGGNGGGGLPFAYAEPSTDYDGVYAMPLASANTPSSVVRLTAEQEASLQEHGFPIGLSQELVRHVDQSMLRCWIIDNSGSSKKMARRNVSFSYSW